MKKWIVPLILVVVLLFWGFNVNNSAVDYNETVKKQWGNVETSYQRRNDLIGNLVNTVKGAADFERGTLTDVIEARSKATQTNIDAANITPEQLQQYSEAQSGLSSALSRLLVTVERYPELKANQNFLKLQDELASTENTIQTARTRFNEAVESYNQYVNKMPRKLVASMIGFDEKPYFSSEAGAEKPVDVEFDFGS